MSDLEEAPSINSTESSADVASSNLNLISTDTPSNMESDSALNSQSSTNPEQEAPDTHITTDASKQSVSEPAADKGMDMTSRVSSEDKVSSSLDSDSSRPDIVAKAIRSETELIERSLLKVIERSDEPKKISSPPTEEAIGIRPAMKACSYPEVTHDAIFHIESTNPFKGMKVFTLAGVENKALTLQSIPASYRPYKGCMFVSCLLAMIQIYYDSTPP